MKRYLLFAGYDFYPHGGWLDFKESFAAPGEAIQAGTDGHEADPASGDGGDRWEWWHAIDTETGEMIGQGGVYMAAALEAGTCECGHGWCVHSRPSMTTQPYACLEPCSCKSYKSVRRC